MFKLKDLVKQNLKKHNLTKESTASLVLSKCNDYISEFLGKDGAENLKAIKYQNNIIHVKSSSSIWSQEFHFWKTQILSKLNSDFTEFEILDFNIKL